MTRAEALAEARRRKGRTKMRCEAEIRDLRSGRNARPMEWQTCGRRATHVANPGPLTIGPWPIYLCPRHLNHVTKRECMQPGRVLEAINVVDICKEGR